MDDPRYSTICRKSLAPRHDVLRNATTDRAYDYPTTDLSDIVSRAPVDAR
jgi:hypothetical protein